MGGNDQGPGESDDVEIRYDVRIPLPDGTRLAANLYQPARGGAHPAIVTLNPYHKDGRGGAARGDAYYRHFAARGYAVLHIDLRGTGSSEGRPYRTMDGREREDGHDAVEWIARQPWCSGAVGVWGTSYGGITAMAIAETRPPHLRAIVPVHAPDDNYAAMMVHQGSRLMFWPDPHWGANMAASNLMPPLRYAGGSEWLSLWRQRLEVRPWIFDWHGTPPDPEYWSRQRIDPTKIEVPTFVICGWQDAYTDGAARVYVALNGPKRLLYGPWKHAFPEQAVREPIGILAEIDRWWDRWLKGADNGVDGELPVTLYIQGIEEWRHEREWPVTRVATRALYPQSDTGLVSDPSPAATGHSTYDYDARAGLAGLPYDACTGPIPYPQDQSADDYLSALYTTPPLAEDVELLGQPQVVVFFSTLAPLPEVHLVAKLCDVTPDGQSFLITHDSVSGAQCDQAGDGEETPIHRATIALRPTAYVCRKGHRLRLALSGSNFPHLWPTPRRYQMRFYHTEPYQTTLSLPEARPQEPRLPLPRFSPPLDLQPVAAIEAGESYAVHRELVSRSASFEGKRTGKVQVEPGVTLAVVQHFMMSVDADHPENATSRTTATWRLDRPTGAVDVEVATLVTLDDVSVHARIDLDGHPYFRHEWQKTRS